MKFFIYFYFSKNNEELVFDHFRFESTLTNQNSVICKIILKYYI